LDEIEFNGEEDEPLTPPPGPRIWACAAGCGRMRTRKSVALPVVPFELLLNNDPIGLDDPKIEEPIALADDGIPDRISPEMPPRVDGIWVAVVEDEAPAGNVKREPPKPEFVLPLIEKL
jgi:hypothetical protein